MPPDSDRPINLSFTPDQAAEIHRLRGYMIGFFGSAHAAAAANILACGLALERNITPDQHMHELDAARRTLETTRAGGGSA